MIVGSLIKNPGGRSGADRGLYCGKRRSDRELRIPSDFSGTRKRGGSISRCHAVVLSGIFPGADCSQQCGKRCGVCGKYYERLGYGVIPNGTESRHDIIQAVELGSAEGVIAFCKGIQAAALWTAMSVRNRGQCRDMTVM